MARYRLRLLLQEFDLAPGETVLGRSPECHVTLDDPLVSREHAKIFVDGERPVLRDLGSRNGSKVNGQTVLGEVELHDGDRIRIGNQELVFSRVVAPKRPGRPTGSLRHCQRCRQPYAAEAPACPNCGWVPGTDETLSGQLPEGVVDRRRWNLQLQVELLEKAISLGRAEDTDRVLRRIRTGVDEWIAEGEVDLAAIEPALSGALRVASASGAPEWMRWAFDVVTSVGTVPTAAFVEQICSTPLMLLEGGIDALQAMVRELSIRAGATIDSPEIAALGELVVRVRETRGSANLPVKED